MSEPQFNATLANALKGGFSSFSDNIGSRGFIDGEPDLDQLQAAHDEAVANFTADQKIAELFSSSLGQEVLQFFKNKSLMCVQFNPEETNAEQTGFFRGGEANWVLRIMHAIARAEMGPPQLPDALKALEGERDEG